MLLDGNSCSWYYNLYMLSKQPYMLYSTDHHFMVCYGINSNKNIQTDIRGSSGFVFPLESICMEVTVGHQVYMIFTSYVIDNNSHVI